MKNKKRNVIKTMGGIVFVTVLFFTGCPEEPQIGSFVNDGSKIFTVTFDPGEGGSAVVMSQLVHKGFTLDPVPDPENENKDLTFIGWYRKGEINLWNFDRNGVGEDITLVARWLDTKQVKLAIKFTSEDPISDSTVDAAYTLKAILPGDIPFFPIGETPNLSDYIPVKTGYNFMGWSNSEYNKAGYISSLDDIWNRITESTEVTLTAKWAYKATVGGRGAFQPVGPGDLLIPFSTAGIDPNLSASQNLSASSIIDTLPEAPAIMNQFNGVNWDHPALGNLRVHSKWDVPRPDLIDSEGVFEFYLNETRDWDGNNRDRQRMEIRSNASAGGASLGRLDDILTYYWKIRLPENVAQWPLVGHFHIFQLKPAAAVPESSMPLFTVSMSRDGDLTFSYNRFGSSSSSVYNRRLAGTNLRNVAGKWVSIEITVHHNDNGYIFIRVTDLEANESEGEVLVEEFASIDTWRRPEQNVGGVWVETNLPATTVGSGQFNRTKFGMYRAVNDQSQVVNMLWTDMVHIIRNKETFRFLDGHSPMEAGPRPTIYDYDVLRIWTNEAPAIDSSNVLTRTKASLGHTSTIANILQPNTTFWNFPNTLLNNGTDRGRLPVWIAVDLGQSRDINEVILNFVSQADYQRLDSLYIAVTSDEDAWNELKNNSETTGVYVLNSDMTTLDPLGLHTDDEKYYTGANPYPHADKWFQFVRIPRLSEGSVPGIPANITINNVFNRLRKEAGMIPGREELTGRYVILYGDPWPYTNESRSSVTAPRFADSATIGISQFLIRNNPEARGETGEFDEYE